MPDFDRDGIAQSQVLSPEAPASAVCQAPFANLYFDRKGDVRVCCWNWREPVGNVLTDTIDEIWRGEKIEALRRTLSRRLSAGCDFCRFQQMNGAQAGLKMRKFDGLGPPATEPGWPRQMEFSISSVCNLECVMCDAAHSSAIRSRQQLPPAPQIYSDKFLDSLRPYLPHLVQAKFLGGEPFLAREHYKLWAIMVAEGLEIRCHVTTNATQYSRRIERVLDRLPFAFSVSLDAATAGTFQQIRVNADFAVVLRNARRFRDYAQQRGTSFGFTFCLMRPNWKEFGAFCRLGDEWNVPVSVNSVLEPKHLAIYSLPIEELGAIVKGLESEAIGLDRELGRNRNVWFGEFDRIQRAYRARARRPGP